jgi:hypothetical protein
MMSERVALAIVAGVVLIALVAGFMARGTNALAEAIQLQRELGIGLVGALGGYALAKATGDDRP